MKDQRVLSLLLKCTDDTAMGLIGSLQVGEVRVK